MTSPREALGVGARHAYFFKRLMYSSMVNAFVPLPPHSGYLAIDCKWFIQLLLMAKHRLDFNLRPGALSWITGSEVSWLLGRTPEVE